MRLLHEDYARPQANETISVHLDTFTAMTGASILTYKLAPVWHYDRTETAMLPSDYNRFDYVLINSLDLVRQLVDFETIGTTQIHDSLQISKPKLPMSYKVKDLVDACLPIRLVLRDAVYILRNKRDRDRLVSQMQPDIPREKEQA